MARLFNVTISARDPIALGRFWSRAIEFAVVTEGPDLVRLDSGGIGPDLLLLRVDDAASTSASTLHLDLAANDPVNEVHRLVALGAQPIDVGIDGAVMSRSANGIVWYVLADPEGNEFCVGGEP